MVEWGSPYFGETAGDAAGGMRSCLAEGASCQYTSFEDQRGTRQYTGELLVFQRLVRECRLVRNPALADYFLLPAFYGTCIAARWSNYPISNDLCPPGNRATEHMELPYLTNLTAARHLLLCSTDIQFCPLVRRLLNVTLIHLGDDHAIGSGIRHFNIENRRICRTCISRQGFLLPNALTIPFRVSHWLHNITVDGTRIRTGTWAGTGTGTRTGTGGRTALRSKPRRYLLSGNVNPKRHRCRAAIAAGCIRAAKRLNISSLVNVTVHTSFNRDNGLRNGANPLDVSRAAALALDSIFCLTPTGDNKGFTARFYFVLQLGCLPVFIDCWRRNYSVEELALPFPTLIDWQRLAIIVPMGLSPSEVVTMLYAMPQHEIERRQLYLKQASHWLSFDDPHYSRKHLDAPAALITELENRVAHSRRHR